MTCDRTKQMLVEANQEDLALYRYVKEELYPTYRWEYGDSIQADLSRYEELQDSRGYNSLNANLSRMKSYLLIRPLLRLYRSGNKCVGY